MDFLAVRIIYMMLVIGWHAQHNKTSTKMFLSLWYTWYRKHMVKKH